MWRREPTILDVFGNTYLPEAIKIHPEYTGSVDPVKRAIFDIAVIKLLTTIDYNDYQKRVYLPTRNVLTGDVGMLSGWGSVSLSPIQFSNKLQAAWMTILDLPSCSTRIDHPLSIDQFCAYQRPGVGAAIGDSGNPLIINNKVVGLLLASYPFATGEPELYLNVYMHVSFIRNIIEKH
ncbi:PREDICTED: chymotrypsin-1-like [Ceratosolen solmsi marchali]|uniref:Chymotrypsin-1-like n=1 Tax=Ceratosolen solmsi marchali TaxID=326594 RepID=A0AAJ6YSE5_9HYME|nr:PREDICTED: chymotrypsin-1-like [Ceratosolen solmsi marchali]